MTPSLDRRQWFTATAAGAALAAAPAALATAPPGPAATPKPAFGYCLNTSTIRSEGGKPRPLIDLIAIASKAGYTAIEPWISEIDDYLKIGTLKGLKKRLDDAGLVVPDAIGFAEWIVEDADRRKKGLEQAKRDMEKVAAIGGLRMAAPPVGATGGGSKRDDPKFTEPVLDLLAAADRYRALFEIGQVQGVTPIVEVWGFSRTLKRLGETLLVAAESGQKGAAILPDIYHLYKGGSDFAGLQLLNAAAIGIFHVNDYPRLERAKITDADRVYPGDGIAPLGEVFSTLHKIGYHGFLSLELFNRDYWKQDPLEVAATGLKKMQAAVAKAVISE